MALDCVVFRDKNTLMAHYEMSQKFALGRQWALLSRSSLRTVQQHSLEVAIYVLLADDQIAFRRRSRDQDKIRVAIMLRI